MNQVNERREANINLAVAAFEDWVRDLTDGELHGLLFDGTEYPLRLTGWVRVHCYGPEEFERRKQEAPGQP